LYRALIRLTDKEFFIRVCGSGLPDRWYIFVPNMPFLVHFERPWDEKSLVYFVAICYSYCHAGIFYVHLVFWCPYVWYTYFSHFGLFYEEKSGNPGVVSEVLSQSFCASRLLRKYRFIITKIALEYL
jgi:hypothetical protein